MLINGKASNMIFDNDLKDFLSNKIIHFKQLIKNPELNSLYDDINLLDSFCISFEDNEFTQNIFLKKENIKYSLKDFDLQGLICANGKQSLKNDSTDKQNQIPIFIREYQCEFSNTGETEIFRNILIKKYTDFYYFNMFNRCYGLIQKINNMFICEFRFSVVLPALVMLKLLIFFSDLNSKNQLIIRKHNKDDSISLPICFALNISNKLNLYIEIISKIVTIENELIIDKFKLPNIISKEDIDVINELYLITTENRITHNHEITYDNCCNEIESLILHKGYLLFKASFNVRPTLNYSLYGHSISFIIEEILLKNAEIATMSKSNIQNENPGNNKVITISCNSENFHFQGQRKRSTKNFSSYRAFTWQNKITMYGGYVVNEFLETKYVSNFFDLRIITDNQNTVNFSICIKDDELKKLKNIETINGGLGLSNCRINNLGNLREVKGGIGLSSWKIESELISLGNLEKVGGNLDIQYSNILDLGKLAFVGGEVDLRYTNIISLGKLKRVNGKLNLRDTNLKDLGELEFVGGDLFLPKKLKNLIDISGIEVKGQVRYWKDLIRNVSKPEKLLGLSKSKLPIPILKNQNIYSLKNFEFDNNLQKEFYIYFKRSFLNGCYIELPKYSNYIFVLFYELVKKYRKKNRVQKLKNYFEILEKYYPITKSYTNNKLIEIYENNCNYEESWNIKCQNEFINMADLIKYSKKINSQILSPDVIVKVCGQRYLTKFGWENIEKVKKFIPESLNKFESRIGKSFFQVFAYKDLKKGSEKFDSYFKSFFINKREFKYYKSIDEEESKQNYYRAIPNVVEKAIINQLMKIIRDAENSFREEYNIPKVGEGWIQETELYNKILKEFPDYDVIHHGKPKWIGRQHLDIYIPQIKLAIEFQGEQHFEPIDFFGGEESFKNTVERDTRKQKLCKKNKCELIIVSSGYDFKEIVNKINLIISALKK